jgi:site-specific recombinase XerC
VGHRAQRPDLIALDQRRVRRRAAGLPETLDLHCPRHSYITHVIEFDYPERFVQDQAGHAYASTTAIYTGVSDEYRTRLVTRALQRRHAELWDEDPT